MSFQPVMTAAEWLAILDGGLSRWIAAVVGTTLVRPTVVGVAAFGPGTTAGECTAVIFGADRIDLSGGEGLATGVVRHDRAVDRVGEDPAQCG
jgi:hypothetical protein